MHSIAMRLARISFLVLFAALAGVSQAPAQIAVGVSITVAPPLLPVYDQPPIPAPGYIWTPGYWAWDDGDYYWVPGTWVEPPVVGLLWTPGYWGWRDGIYVWNAGYWGPHVGFYGGVNYGFGYGGVGYGGGFWRGGVFSYNTTVNNFGGVHITNVYNRTVIVNNVSNHVSFNGGAGGLAAKPTPQEMTAANEHHVVATTAQTEHQHMASTNRELRASVNGGHPAVAATSHAGHFEGAGVVAAHHEGSAPGGEHPNGEHPGGMAGHPGAGGHGLATGSPGGVGHMNTPKLSNAGAGGHPGMPNGHPGMMTGAHPGGIPGAHPGGMAVHTGGPPKMANRMPPPRRPAPPQHQPHH